MNIFIYIFNIIHDVVSSVITFAISRQLDEMNKYQLNKKFSLKIGVGMDNPVTGLTVK